MVVVGVVTVVVLLTRSRSCEVVGIGGSLIFAMLVVTRGAVDASVLATAGSMVGVSSVTTCVVAAIVTKGGKALRRAVVLEAAAVAAVVAIMGVSWGRIVVPTVMVSAFRLVIVGTSVALGMERPLVAGSSVVSSVGNGAKGVATGCTDVTGNMAGVVASTTAVSVVSRTIDLILDSCSKSVRKAVITDRTMIALKVIVLGKMIRKQDDQ